MADNYSPQELLPGHLQSPLFKRIPTELRLDIYRHTFAGSETLLQIQPDTPHSHHHTGDFLASESIWLPSDSRRIVFTTRGRYLKYQLLLTCRQIYDEALATYWSETIVWNHGGYLSRGLFFERIPDFAKLHIKHLRDVQTDVNPGAEALRGVASSRQASFAEALDAFPRLQTCSIRDGAKGKMPSKAAEEALVRHPEIHLLKYFLEIESYDDHPRCSHINLILKKTYMNLTTGMQYTAAGNLLHSWWNSQTDEEEGFQHVMKAQPPERAGGNGEA